MKAGRRVTVSTLALSIVIGCGSDDSSSSGGVAVVGPDGGTIVAPPAPVPPPVGGRAPDGIFVSVSRGIAGADGARSRPVKTLAEGLKLAAEKHLPLLACPEVYTESVTIPEGVSMFGYYDCSNVAWPRGTMHATIASPTSPAVSAVNVYAPARFEGFDVKAPDLTGTAAAGTPAVTSYAMVIKNSANLGLSEVVLRGGKGQDGTDAVEPAKNQELGSATGVSAGMQMPCSGGGVCTSSTTTAGKAGGTSKCKVGGAAGPGGAGGTGIFLRFGGPVVAVSETDAHGKPLVATSTTAAGGLSASLDSASIGAKGGNGAVGALGENGTWSFNESGFVPGNGTAGGNGGPGQGGGGGGGGTTWYSATYGPPATIPNNPPQYGISGAGGGAGGCGGVAGSPGSGGGASVGLLVVASKVIEITQTTITSGKGGRAGKGATGTAGLPGGNGGAGKWAGVVDARPSGVYGLAGGGGGTGGQAGMSGHGAPGPSIAFVYSGERPNINSSTTQIAAGAGGDGYPEIVTPLQTRPGVVGEGKGEHSF